MMHVWISLTDTLLADLQSSTLTVDHSCSATAHRHLNSTMASRLSTDSLDADGQVSFIRLFYKCISFVVCYNRTDYELATNKVFQFIPGCLTGPNMVLCK